MKLGKKILITLGVLVVLLGAVFVIFHDNSDVEQIEKEQISSSQNASEEMNDALNDSFEE